MLRPLLIGLILSGALFSQEEVIIKKVICLNDSTAEMTIDATVKDKCLDLNIGKGGKCLKYKIDLDDLEAAEAALKDLEADVHIKTFKHDDFLFCSKSTFLGVKLQDLNAQLRTYFKVKKDQGVLVSEVVEDSPAEKARIKAGDVVIKVDDTDIHSASELSKAIISYEPGEKVVVAVNRKGRIKKLKPTLTEKNRNLDFEAHCPPGLLDDKKMKQFVIQKDKCLPKDLPMPLHLEEMKKHQAEMEALRKDLEEMKKDLEALKK